MINRASSDMRETEDSSVALVVTSPPYPMIEMWDDIFCKQNPNITPLLANGNGQEAFENMHKLLDKTWREVDRVLIEGGFVCINVGDATRSLNGIFQVFSNHSRIISFFIEKGYSVLPDIIWHKPTNSPNKFMGSGMYPAGAYVTYEHEYILIFRKGGKRQFQHSEEKQIRQASAFFWEERNVWFSDIWEIKGTIQRVNTTKTRERSGAFPFEIPYRLINMYSVYGDIVLDPFAGTGTTLVAAITTGRNSVGYDIEKTFCNSTIERLESSIENARKCTDTRILDHQRFIESLSDEKRNKCYRTLYYPFLVKTKQEIGIKLPIVQAITAVKDGVECEITNI